MAISLAVKILVVLKWLILGLAVGLATVARAEDVGVEQSNYNIGVLAYKTGDFRRAFDAWSLGAYEGVTEAQYNLGVLYLEGRGVESNIAQARTWFLKAAEKGHVEAQYNLGHMALSGMGADKSVPEALSWWRQAAEGGYAQAQFNYGRALYLGIDESEDSATGLDFIRQAAAQDDPRAIKFLQQNPQAVALQNTAEPKVVSAAEKAEAESLSEQASAQVAEREKSASVAQSVAAEQVAMGSSTAPARLEIVRDQRRLESEYLMRTVEQTVDVFSAANNGDLHARLKPSTIVRVIGVDGDKLQIETPAEVGTSGWIHARNLAYSGESSQQLRAAWAEGNKPRRVNTETSLGQGGVKHLDSKILNTPSVAALPSPKPVATAKSEQPVVTTDVPGVADMDDNTWLFTQAPGAFVVHLFTLLDRKKALKVAAQPVFADHARVYSTRAKGQEWVFVLLGPYESEALALAARKALPAAYRKDARVRGVELIAKNRCAKRSLLSATQARGLDAYCLE